MKTICSERDGAWSAGATWNGGSVPRAGARVLIRAGHTVTYDISSEQAIRVIHVAGTLTFATDRNTRLDVGLIRVQPGEDTSEDGFDCDAHMEQLAPGIRTSALVVGSPDQPVRADVTARLRLRAFDGMDRDTCPAIVCCGGRMEFHGTPMSRTWVKLGQTARKGDTTLQLAEPVTGWRVGDRVIVTATERDGRKRSTLRPGASGRRAFTEERTIAALVGLSLTLDQSLDHNHEVRGEYAGEVANLSRNVVIESAEPERSRGHTMYHRGSSGSISYTEFRHLGKEGVLGRYSLHFHQVGDTMRGTSVVGASIWDSGNRWITIHGTSYLVVRDCVGYQSVGHGFYLEDGSENYNVLDRNLAVQAFAGKPLPGQFLESDRNDGAGFWWANSLNSFTRNVAAECDRYGYRYEATPRGSAALVRPVLRRTAGAIRSTSGLCRLSGSRETRPIPSSMASTWVKESAGWGLTQLIRFWSGSRKSGTHSGLSSRGRSSVVIDGMDVFSCALRHLPSGLRPAHTSRTAGRHSRVCARADSCYPLRPPCLVRGRRCLSESTTGRRSR